MSGSRKKAEVESNKNDLWAAYHKAEPDYDIAPKREGFFSRVFGGTMIAIWCGVTLLIVGGVAIGASILAFFVAEDSVEFAIEVQAARRRWIDEASEVSKKTCKTCNKKVPDWCEVGDSCPHCGVTFGTLSRSVQY